MTSPDSIRARIRDARSVAGMGRLALAVQILIEGWKDLADMVDSFGSFAVKWGSVPEATAAREELIAVTGEIVRRLEEREGRSDVR